MKNYLKIAIAVLILSACDPCKDEPPKYDSLYSELQKRDKQIETLQELSWNYHQDYLREQAAKDSILAIRPQRRESIARLPEVLRDSLFMATTDTVSVPENNRLVPVEVDRITAANVLFSDLDESLKIRAVQEKQITAMSGQLSAKDSEIGLLNEASAIKSEIIDGKSEDVAKEKRRAERAERKVTVWKVLSAVALGLGILI